MKRWMMPIVLIVAATILSTPCTAEEPGGWHFSVIPYMWFGGLEGDITVGNAEVEFDKSASDLLSALELGLSVSGVVQYDRFLLWGQFDYFSLSTDELAVDDQPDRGVLDSELAMGQVVAGYRIDGFYPNQVFDLLGGVRILDMDNELDLGLPETRGGDSSAVDPFVIGRASLPIAPSRLTGWTFDLVLGIGGGGDSDLVYEIAPQVQWQFSRHVAVRAAYRTIGYDLVDDDGNRLDFRQAGPAIGLGIYF